MVTQITLKDTGYYDVGKTYPADNTAEERAYGSAGTVGTTLNLNADDASLTIGTLLNDEVVLQKKDDDNDTKRFELGEVDKVGTDYPVWVIKGTFDTTATTTDCRDYGRLCHMIKTKGVKQLGVGAATDCELISYSHYGEREYDSEATKTVALVNVRIVNCVFKQIVKQGEKITYTLTLRETNPWDDMS